MLVIFILYTLVSCIWSEERTLRMAHALYRHGARAPIVDFPSDSHKDKWPVDPGMLTTVGMNMEYELGKFLKNRYMIDRTFLNETYTQKEVYVRSADVPRCLQSAETQLAGLYPPKGYQVWNEEIRNWQPVPVHSVPANQDPLLRGKDTDCPRREELWKLKKQSQEYQLKAAENQALFWLLSNATGVQVDINNFWIIYDVLKCEDAQGFGVDNWATDEVRKQITRLGDWTFFNKFSADDELARLIGGVLLFEVRKHMLKYNRVKTYADGMYKMHMYSAHDTTLLSLATALDVPIAIPTFAASIFIELYENQSGEMFVEMYYKNDASTNLIPLQLNKCSFSCPLEQFLKLTAVRSTESQECSPKSNDGIKLDVPKITKLKRSFKIKKRIQ